MWGVQKTILIIVAVVMGLVGCGVSKGEQATKAKAAAEARAVAEAKAAAEAKADAKANELEAWVSDPGNPQNVIVEQEIRKKLEKPTGELTKADLEKLTDLSLRNTQITDAGLKEVAKLKRLTTLDLSYTEITDAGLKEVAKITQLTRLHLWGCKQVTDTGLKELAELKQLESLSLKYTEITDAGLKEVAKMEKLTNLSLYGCKQLTDAGLEEVAKMKQLTYLDLYETQVTEAGVTQLSKTLPKCNIHSHAKKMVKKATETETETKVPSDNLVAYYPFNGNARDESGHGHDGTVIGARLTADRHGNADSAYQFKPGDHIQIVGLMGQPKSLTLSAWAKLDGQQGPNGADIVSLGDVVGLRGDGKDSRVGRYGTGGIIYMGGSRWLSSTAPVNITGTGWHQIVFTVDDATHRTIAYVDGQERARKTAARSVDYRGLGENTHIGIHGEPKANVRGGNAKGSLWHSQGSIDDIRIYDRALSAREVKALFLKEKPVGKLQAGKEIKVTTVAVLRAKAEAGDAKSQNLLGLKINRGQNGLKKNPQAVEKWVLRAANQGLPVAQMNLGSLYSRDDLGERDPAKAYRWAKLSLQSGIGNVLKPRAQQLVDKLEKELNPQQIAEADAFVKAFKPVREAPPGNKE